jgi:hypothetical protein
MKEQSEAERASHMVTEQHTGEYGNLKHSRLFAERLHCLPKVLSHLDIRPSGADIFQQEEQNEDIIF